EPVGRASDQRDVEPRGGVRLAPALFPVAERCDGEVVGSGELRLRQAEPGTDRLDVDLVRNGDNPLLYELASAHVVGDLSQRVQKLLARCHAVESARRQGALPT